jgi:hypothetical protein
MSTPWDKVGGESAGHRLMARLGRAGFTPAQLRSLLLITLAALGLYLLLRWLPTGTNLSHMDFRVEGKGALEMCDPANPQFIPVVAVRSPVQATLASDRPPALNQETRFTLTLRTASGKPIAPEDLLVAHTRKLHLLVVDPTLQDYQHVHPEPGRRAGEWVFTMAPGRPGVYRVFADFTPVVTQRGLYASVDFTVPGDVARVMRSTNSDNQVRGFRFALETPGLFRAGVPADLRLRIESPGEQKEPVPLQPVMGAFAHVVAFDEERTGFAHLHPQETDLGKPPDALRPVLNFKVTIPRPGRYVIWAQVNLGGEEAFAPFWLDVLP